MVALLILIGSNLYLSAGAETISSTVVQYDSDTPYRLNEPIVFPDLVVTYKGNILEPGHQKRTSEVFEFTSGSTTKQVAVPMLSISGTLVRFGLSFYRIFNKPALKTISVRRGVW